MTFRNIIFISSILLMGCTATKKTMTQTTTTTPTVIVPKVVSAEMTAQGKDLYENRCGKCHILFAPSKFTAERWPAIVKSMQNKARISDEQKEMIIAYVSTHSKK